MDLGKIRLLVIKPFNPLGVFLSLMSEGLMFYDLDLLEKRPVESCLEWGALALERRHHEPEMLLKKVKILQSAIHTDLYIGFNASQTHELLDFRSRECLSFAILHHLTCYYSNKNLVSCLNVCICKVAMGREKPFEGFRIVQRAEHDKEIGCWVLLKCLKSRPNSASLIKGVEVKCETCSFRVKWPLTATINRWHLDVIHSVFIAVAYDLIK